MKLIDVDALPNGRIEWEDIVNAPTIDPVKHGRWMGTVCSACGESFSEYYDCKFCPNCGARMMDEVSE